MAVNLKSYFKLSLLYIMIAAFPPVLQIIVQPFIEGSDRLNAVDFSHIAITESIGVISMILSALAMGNALVRYYYDYMDDHKKFSILVSGTFNSIVFRGGILIILCYIFRDYVGRLFTQPALRDFASYGVATVGIGVSRAINIAAANLFRNQKKVMEFVWLSIAMGAFRVCFQLIGLFYFEMSFRGYVFGSCIGGWIVSAGVLAYTYYHYGFSYNRKSLRPLYVFAIPLFQYVLLTWGLRFIDRFFLESNPVDLGIYDTVMKFALGIELIMIGINGAVRPEVFRYMKDGTQKHQFDIKRLSNVFLAQVQIIIAMAVFPVMLYINYLFETDIRFAYKITTIVFARYILQAQYLIFLMPVYYKKKTRAMFWINSIGLIFNIGFNYWLIPIFSYYGAIASALLTQFILVQLMYFYQKRISGISWNLSKTYFFPLGIIALTVIGEFIKNIFSLNDYIMSGLLVILICASLLILYGKDINLKKIIHQFNGEHEQYV